MTSQLPFVIDDPSSPLFTDEKIHSLKPELLSNLYGLAMAAKSDLTRIQATKMLLDIIKDLEAPKQDINLSNVTDDDLKKIISLIENNHAST